MYYTYMYLEDCHSERLGPPLLVINPKESSECYTEHIKCRRTKRVIASTDKEDGQD